MHLDNIGPQPAPQELALAAHRQRLGMLRIADPLMRATIRRPGMEADDRDIGRSFGMLVEKTRELTGVALSSLRDESLLDEHNLAFAAHQMAVTCAQVVAQHWEAWSTLDREAIHDLIETVMESHRDFIAQVEPPEEVILSEVTDWQVTWIHTAIRLTDTVMLSRASLGHDKHAISRFLLDHMMQSTRAWAKSLVTEDDEPGEQLMVEQRLAHYLTDSYAALWLKEVEDVKALLGTMSPEQIEVFQKEPYDLDLLGAHCDRMISAYREMAELIDDAVFEVQAGFKADMNSAG